MDLVSGGGLRLASATPFYSLYCIVCCADNGKYFAPHRTRGWGGSGVKTKKKYLGTQRKMPRDLAHTVRDPAREIGAHAWY